MANEIITRIMLSGTQRGGALLKESGGITNVSLKLQGDLHGLSVFTVGSNGILRTESYDGTLDIPQTGICAMALAKEGKLIASGFTGACRQNRAGILDEIRIRAAEYSAKGATERMPEHDAETNGNARPKLPPTPSVKHTSDVTEGILAQARMLFNMLGGTEAGIEASEDKATEDIAAEKKPADDYKNVENPFPKTFPGSSWKQKSGEEELVGRVFISGRERTVIAVPVNMRDGRTRTYENRGRIIVSKSGFRYFITFGDGD